MSDWKVTPLGAWAAGRPTAQIVNLAVHRQTSARWALQIEPRAIGALASFDRMLGLEPAALIVAIESRKRA